MSVYPLAEQTMTPYQYCNQDPVNMIDPTGMKGESTGVKDNGDGTYKVVSVNTKDKDNGVYIVDKNGKYDTKTSKKIGYTQTTYSFFNADINKAQKDAVIDPSDTSGREFVSDMITNTPALLDYMYNGTEGGKYDFKTTNGTNKRVYNEVEDYYRGFILSVNKKDNLPIFASARDVGNIGAGYVAAFHKIRWGYARLAFDALETKQQKGAIATSLFYPLNKSSEALGTQAAQLLGYKFYEKYGKR